jgi:hypothetical protein
MNRLLAAAELFDVTGESASEKVGDNLPSAR